MNQTNFKKIFVSLIALALIAMGVWMLARPKYPAGDSVGQTTVAPASAPNTTSSGRHDPQAVATTTAHETTAKTAPPAPTAPVTDGLLSSIRGLFSGTAKVTGLPKPGADLGSAAPADRPTDRRVASPEVATPPIAPCVTVNYTHKQMQSHATGEACTHHRNLIRLSKTNVNAKSICVRVNGRPVKYTPVKGHADELIIGPVAGQQAKVSVRYCFDSHSCSEDCTIPKDDFMEAIGASDDESAPVAHWDSDDKQDATSEIDPEIRRELANAEELSVFQDWNPDAETPACGARKASL